MTTLGAIIAPHGEDEFLKSILGRSALYVSGNADRFQEVLSWSALNRLLAFGGLGHPRLRLISAGNELPAELYVRNGVSGYPRPLVSAINSAFGAGAIIAIESVDELHEPVSLLCHVLEQKLEIPVRADLNASLAAAEFSGLRWHETDLIVMRIEGKKTWRVYCPTASYPTTHEPPAEPTGNPVWEGIVAQGDLLYIPKGWWYSEKALDPGIDLGVVFRNPTGQDVVQRVASQVIINSEELRKDCPRFSDARNQSAFLRLFQTEMARACAKPGVVLNMLREIREFAEPRIHFDLPWSATALPPSDDFLVSPLLRFPRPDSFSHSLEDDSVEMFINGKMERFHMAAERIVSLLCDNAPISVGDLLAGCPEGIAGEQLLESLSELVKHGVVELRKTI